MDPQDISDGDNRVQPWKAWVQEELQLRKEADKTEAGRASQEDRIRAFNKAHNCGQGGSSGNKAG